MTFRADPDTPIVASDLTIDYPAHGASAAFTAVTGLSFRLAPGEVLGLMGESGSGKSTIARVLSGASALSGRAKNGAQADVAPRISGGDAWVLGKPLRRITRRSLTSLRFGVGLLEQDAAAALPASSTVTDIVAAPVLERDPKFNRTDLSVRVATLVDAVRLPLTALTKYPYELSSGQRQRVALARALVLDPALLIADEPTAGVDVTVRDAVSDLLIELQSERAFSALVISSDLHVLRRVSSRIGVMHQGVLVGLGPIDEVFRNPWHPYVTELAAALAISPSPQPAARSVGRDTPENTPI
jgi:ABC-type glutathione transport system ATPase component